jgi:Uma2 family endonuclease
MSKPEPLPRMTEEEFMQFELKSPGRHEFHAGEVLAMAGGNFLHSVVKGNVNRMLGNALLKRPCRVADSDMLVTIRATDRKFYPDSAVVCGRPKFQDLRELELLNPLVIVEVLSETTAAYDRGKKFWHYRHLDSLEEYVLVSTDEPLVEVYLRGEGGVWSLRTFDGLEGIAHLQSIEIELPLREIYAKTAVAGEAELPETEAT